MTPESLDLRRIRAFQLVVEHGSLRKAASRLGVTVSAVSFALKRLEEELGTQLFQRYPNKLVLTAAGERLAVEAGRILRDIEGMLGSLATPKPVTSRLNVSISNDLTNYLAAGFGAFVRQHPNIALNISVHRSEDALALVSGGQIDLAVGRFGRQRAGSGSSAYVTLAIEPLVETPFVLVCRKDDPLLRQQQAISLQAIALRPLITLPSGSSARALIDAAFTSASITPSSRIEAGDCRTIQRFVEHGLGVGLVHAICVSGSPHLVTLDVARHFAAMRFSVAYRRKDLTTGLTDFLPFLAGTVPDAVSSSTPARSQFDRSSDDR